MKIIFVLLALVAALIFTLSAGASSNCHQSLTRSDAAEKKVCVLGNVTNPSMVSFHDGMTVTQAIKDAGGIPKNSKSNKVRVYSLTSEGRNRIIYVDLKQIRKKPYTDLELQSFDIVEVVFGPRELKDNPAPSNPCFSKPFPRMD